MSRKDIFTRSSYSVTLNTKIVQEVLEELAREQDEIVRDKVPRGAKLQIHYPNYSYMSASDPPQTITLSWSWTV